MKNDNMPALRSLLAAIAAALAMSCAWAQSVAITIDDGPNIEATPRMTTQQRNRAMLDALAKHHVQAALFVTAGFGADRPEGMALAREWSAAGHAIGNHTMTHPDLDKVALEKYQQEVLDCDSVIRTLPGYQKWLRYTYLREGNTPAKLDGMRSFLKTQGYRNAYVSLDTSDWRLNEKLVEVLRKDPQADTSAIRTAYLAHIKQRALAYRELSWKLQGRDIAQVMLIHHNLINAMWLDDVLTQFRDMGWTITTPAKAFDDPVYQLQPQRAAPGQSLLLSMARTLGHAKFPGWERLVDDGDHEIEALAAKGF